MHLYRSFLSSCAAIVTILIFFIIIAGRPLFPKTTDGILLYGCVASLAFLVRWFVKKKDLFLTLLIGVISAVLGATIMILYIVNQI